MKLRARLVCLGVTFITASVLMGFHVGRLSVQREMGDRWSEHSVQSDSAKKNLPDIPGPAHHHHSQKLRAKVAKEEPDYLQVVEQLDMKAKLIREADEILSKREMPKDQLPQKQIPKVEEGRNFPSPITLKPRNKSEIHHKQPDILENIPNQPKDKLHDQHLNPPAPPPANQQDQHQAVGRSQEGQAAEPASRQNPPAAPPPANQQRAETQNVANKNKQNIHYAGEPIEILPEPEPLKTVSVVPVADVFGREFLPHRECIHLSVVVCGDRTEETLIMLKSSAALTKRCLVFHIFAEDDLQGGIRDLLNSWPDSFKDRVTEYIYPITFPSDENKEEWKKVFKLCATQRLFLPDLLPNVDALLYVDTDILFIRPLEKIWHFFSKFNSSQLAALAPEHEVPNIGWYNRFARHPYYGKTGLNSGVMLMNLTRLRDFKWTNRIIPFYRQYRYKITWGDQDLINVVFYFHPDKVFEYPCEWNYRPDHCMYGNNCGRIETEGISVIHGNRGVYHNEKQLPFRSIYETFRDYQLGATISAGLVQPLKERWADSNLINMYCTKALRKPILSTLARYT